MKSVSFNAVTHYSISRLTAHAIYATFLTARLLEQGEIVTGDTTVHTWYLTPKGAEIFSRFCRLNSIDEAPFQAACTIPEHTLIDLLRDPKTDSVQNDCEGACVVLDKMLSQVNSGGSRRWMGRFGERVCRSYRSLSSSTDRTTTPVQDKQLPLFSDKYLLDWLMDHCTFTHVQEAIRYVQFLEQCQLVYSASGVRRSPSCSSKTDSAKSYLINRDAVDLSRKYLKMQGNACVRMLGVQQDAMLRCLTGHSALGLEFNLFLARNGYDGLVEFYLEGIAVKQRVTAWDAVSQAEELHDMVDSALGLCMKILLPGNSYISVIPDTTTKDLKILLPYLTSDHPKVEPLQYFLKLLRRTLNHIMTFVVLHVAPAFAEECCTS